MAVSGGGSLGGGNVFRGVRRGPRPDGASLTGVIRNFTKHDIAFYSENSQGIIVVPAKSWREHVVWHENVDLIGYVQGDPFFCKKVQVMPGQFPFNCKQYDFLAIIGEEAPTAVEGLG